MMTLIEKLAEFPVKTVNVQGQQQAYREAGQGEYLVLLHGISSGSASWVNQLEVLSHHFMSLPGTHRAMANQMNF